jgi:hypothetical protein
MLSSDDLLDLRREKKTECLQKNLQHCAELWKLHASIPDNNGSVEKDVLNASPVRVLLIRTWDREKHR